MREYIATRRTQQTHNIFINLYTATRCIYLYICRRFIETVFSIQYLNTGLQHCILLLYDKIQCNCFIHIIPISQQIRVFPSIHNIGLCVHTRRVYRRPAISNIGKCRKKNIFVVGPSTCLYSHRGMHVQLVGVSLGARSNCCRYSGN